MAELSKNQNSACSAIVSARHLCSSFHVSPCVHPATHSIYISLANNEQTFHPLKQSRKTRSLNKERDDNAIEITFLSLIHCVIFHSLVWVNLLFHWRKISSCNMRRDFTTIGSIVQFATYALSLSFLFPIHSFCSSLCDENNQLRRLDAQLFHKLPL